MLLLLLYMLKVATFYSPVGYNKSIIIHVELLNCLTILVNIHGALPPIGLLMFCTVLFYSCLHVANYITL